MNLHYFCKDKITTLIMTIQNESDYERASERADEIFKAKKGTPEAAELQELLKAIKAYEDAFIRMLQQND
jgi:antitoxin component HigA of HigAB toxin-antitoxin module